jgi:hypothetical protein
MRRPNLFKDLSRDGSFFYLHWRCLWPGGAVVLMGLVCWGLAQSFTVQGGTIPQQVRTAMPGTTVIDPTNDGRFPRQPSATNLVTGWFEAPVDWNDNMSSTSVPVVFTEAVEAVSATDPLHYRLSGGAGVSSAPFAEDTRTILLTTSPVTCGPTSALAMEGIRDRAAAANLLPAGTAMSFTAGEYVPVNVEAP